MENEEALDFYDRITQGTNRSKTIELEHNSGATLQGVEMYVVEKQQLANVFNRLPDEMFESVNDADSAEEAEEQLEEQGMSLSAVSDETVNAFEDLCKESLDHAELTKPQMHDIISELSFETLFELGNEIMNMSAEETGTIRGFRVQG